MDAQTLHIINLSVATTLALTMLGLYYTNRQEKSLIHWALAGAGFWGNALLSLAYNPATTPYWLGPPLGNMLLVSSYLFLLSGLCHFLKQPLRTTLVLGMLALVYLLHFSSFAQAGPVNRTLLCFPLLILISLYILYRLFQAKPQGMRIAIFMFATVISLNILQLAARLPLFIAHQLNWYSLFSNPLINNLGTLAILLFMLGSLTSCLLLLVMQKTVQLERLANTDPLTGWLNRQSMQQRLDSEWHRSKRMQQPLSLLLFDIDYFKQVNDQYGHSMGDRVLQQISAVSKIVLRDYDLLFRVGGEEFLVCLPNVDASQLQRISERLRHKIADTQFNAEPTLSISISVGCATASSDTATWQALLEQADQALYQAKKHGRNRVVHYTTELQSA